MALLKASPKIEDHECFDKLVEETGSDATFEKTLGLDVDSGQSSLQWVVNLYRYTPSLSISTQRGFFVPNYCPMCGMDFRES